jgi:glycolate oxidase iron-sulfur subunit
MANSFSDTEICVKCGMCLPHCPTYGKTLDENESPRGRLALIQGWAAGQLEATPRLLEHIDNCLLCRACEAVCPAQVPYGRLVDDFRLATAKNRPAKPFAERMKFAAVHATLQTPGLQRLAGPARALLRKTGLARAAGLTEMESGLPQAYRHADWRGAHPAQGEETARVALFLGCTAELADAETASAAIALLNRLGVGVEVPAGQACCGALALHAGSSGEAEGLRRKNLAAFDPERYEAILTLASGCGAVLSEYADAPGFSAKVMDIGRFLARRPWPEGLELQPLAATALVHAPCSLRHVLRSERHAPELLRKIPDLRVESLPKATGCCGAAGAYMLEHPRMAADLREDILDKVAAAAPDYLLTSNAGCAMHLRAGLKGRGLERIEVLHPATLLRRRLPEDSSRE